MSQDTKKDFIDIAYKILTHRENNGFTALDLYVVSSIHRIIKLDDGITTLSNCQNLEAAIPLLRMILDTCMRLLAVNIANDHQELLQAFFDGKNISKLKSLDGKPLTDGYLKDKLNELAPGVNKVYDELSSFIHFSEAHFRSIITKDKKIRIGGNNLSDNIDTANDIHKIHKKLILLSYNVLIGYLL